MVGSINIGIRDELFNEKSFLPGSNREYTNNTNQLENEEISEELGDVYDSKYASLLVDTVTDYVEKLVQTFIGDNTSNILDKVGLNKENIELALFIINLTDSTITKLESIIPMIPKNITMIPDAHATLSSIATSFKDMYMAMYLKVEKAVIEEKNKFITNLPVLMYETVNKILNELTNMVYNIIDNQCFLYIGKHLIEIYYMCTPLISLYKKYKAYRKEKHIMDQEQIITEEDKQKKILVEFNGNHFKEILKQQLTEASDLLYNCFIVVALIDTFNAIKSLVEEFNSIDLTVLSNNLDSIEDVINLLEEIGLDGKSWSVELIDAIKLGINDFKNQFNALTKLMVNLGISSASNIAIGALDSLNIDASTSTNKLFDFITTTETNENGIQINAITLNVYSDPFLIKFKNKLTNVLLKSVDNNGKKVFNTGDTIKIIKAVQDGYDKKEDIKLLLLSFLFIIHYEKTDEEKTKEKAYDITNSILNKFNNSNIISSTLSKSPNELTDTITTNLTLKSTLDFINNKLYNVGGENDDRLVSKEISDLLKNIDMWKADNDELLEILNDLYQELKRQQENEYYLQYEKDQEIVLNFLGEMVNEEYTDDPNRTKRRPTIKLLHDLLSVLNTIFPIVKVLATLVRNYKTNKAKALEHSKGNIFAMIKVLAKVNNLLNELSIENTNFYTIRTLKLYDYISQNITEIKISDTILHLDINQTMLLYTYLQNNNLNYKDINIKNNTTLYIDTESLNKQREELKESTDNIKQFFGDDASLFAIYPKAKYADGTTYNIDKIQIAGNTIYYSDSSLPVIGSQILRAISNGYNDVFGTVGTINNNVNNEITETEITEDQVNLNIENSINEIKQYFNDSSDILIYQTGQTININDL